MPSSGQLWHIYHVENCRHTKPHPKPKYVVIVHVDGEALGCFINSILSQWLQDRPYMLVCEVVIPGLNYSGINHDSFIDCQQFYPFNDSELVDSRGLLSDELKTAVLNAIANCPTLPVKYKKAILSRENWPPESPST